MTDEYPYTQAVLKLTYTIFGKVKSPEHIATVYSNSLQQNM